MYLITYFHDQKSLSRKVLHYFSLFKDEKTRLIWLLTGIEFLRGKHRRGKRQEYQDQVLPRRAGASRAPNRFFLTLFYQF